MTHIIFDLGRVLIDWYPELAFEGHFEGPEQVQDWFTQIGFHDWNRYQDGGRSMADGLAQARESHGAELVKPLESYLANFARTIAQPIPGSWELLSELEGQGHALYAITNWGAETWPAALATYPRLSQVFRDIVVSGEVGLLKPEPEIYRLLMVRNDLEAEDCLFIDDTLANVAGARALGMDAIHFTDAPDLARELAARGLI